MVDVDAEPDGSDARTARRSCMLAVILAHQGFARRAEFEFAAAAILVGLDHRLDEHVAQGREAKSDRHAAEHHRFQDRPKLFEGGLEDAAGEVDLVALVRLPA